jgi:hypothetical protein
MPIGRACARSSASVVLEDQAREEVETLERVNARALWPDDHERRIETLHGSLREILVDAGLGHPSFARLALELSRQGAAHLGITALETARLPSICATAGS